MILLANCTTSTSPLVLRELEPPEGGEICQLFSVDQPVGSVPIASTVRGLFSFDGARWNLIPTLPQHRISDCDSGLQLRAAGDQLFALTNASTNKAAQFYLSEDAGESWSAMPLPKLVRDVVRFTRDTESVNTSIRAPSSLRLQSHGGDLFLIHSRNIWRFVDDSWTALDLSGLPFNAKHNLRLPPVVGSYLPASPTRRFELITILSEQNLVYRRAPEQDWVLVSTVTVSAKAFSGVSNQSTVFLSTATGLLRSDDEGESWVSFWKRDQGAVRSVKVIADDNNIVVLVGTDSGKLFRSIDGGIQWAEQDLKAGVIRSISTGLSQGEVWLGSDRRGLYLSTDVGSSFTLFNRGFAADVPFALSVGSKSVVAGGVGGTFSRKVDTEQTWVGNITKPTTASLRTSTGAVWLGTADGEIFELGRPEEIKQPFRDVEFPPFAARRDLRPESVAAFSTLDGVTIAWSKSRGAAITKDNGVTWDPLDFSDAFSDAIASSRIDDFVISRAGWLLAERREQDVRLWRSQDQGLSWSEMGVLRISADAPPIKLMAIPGTADSVAMILDGRLHLSSDGGQLFNEAGGPWNATRVSSISHSGDTLVVLGSGRSRDRFFAIDVLREEDSAYREHDVVWELETDIAEQLDIFASEDFIAIVSRSQIFTGDLPGAGRSLPIGVTLVIALVASLVFALVGFFVVSRETKD